MKLKLSVLKKAIRDAVKCHFEEERRPRVAILHIVKDEILTL